MLKFLLLIIGLTMLISCDNIKKSKIKSDGTFIDHRDGKKYQTVKLGDQIWMAENLNYETDYGSWLYSDSSSQKSGYGRLYNWETACKVCPAGWHLPTDDEWKILEIYAGIDKNDVNGDFFRGPFQERKIKSPGGWHSKNTGTNKNGLNILPGGFRGTNGNFYQMGTDAYFWTSTERSMNYAWLRRLIESSNNIGRYDLLKEYAFSVRCVKDQ